MVTRHGPLDLLLFAADGDNQTILAAITARLYQYRSFNHYDSIRLARGEFVDKLCSARADRRVNQRVEFLEAFGMAEDQRRQFAPVNRAGRVQNPRPEFLDDAAISFTVRLKHLVAEIIRFDQQTTHFGQPASDEALPARETASESDTQHIQRWCASANPTVFDISMPMVNGPTPPGTGV